jgi:hypothetical protein
MVDKPKMSDSVKRFFAETGSQGGKQRAKNLRPEQRKQIARKAARALWKKKRTTNGGKN